ncbi:MAG: hypothetical protein ABIP03_07210 [Aquihabitans sp.]
MTTFGFSSTTDDVLEGVDLTGRNVLITGASSGLDLDTAAALWSRSEQMVGETFDL